MATYTGESTVQASSSLQAYLAGPMRVSANLNASSTVQGYLAGPMRISQALNASSTTKGFLVIASHPAEALVASSGALYASEVMNYRATSTLSGTVRVRSTLQQDGGTNSMGLVMLGSAELAPQRSVATSGTNREYGYWRGSHATTSIANFDQMYVPLEGAGVDGTGKPVISLVTDQGKTVGGATDHPDCLASSKSFSWVESFGGGGYWAAGGGATCLTGCDDPDAPSFDGTTGGQIEYVACKGTPYEYYTGADSETPDGVGAFIGSARWEKAGTLLPQLGNEGPRQRCLFMSKRSFVNLGSGIDLNKNAGAYTAYAKVVPSGDVSGSVILAQHRENPAQFILGCDYDGRYYIRSDYTRKDENYAVQVNSSGNYESYKYPTQIIGTYDQTDSTLKLYVNGILQGVSDAFARSVDRSEVTNVALGKREYALAEKGFTGWIDEVGLSSSAMEQKEITRFYQSTFEISKILFNTKARPTGDSSFAEDEFGDEGLGINNDSYVELVLESGIASITNPEGARGGAFDKTMWGTVGTVGTNVGASSVLTFDLMEIAPRFHQLTDLSVDMWVESISNHPTTDVSVSARVLHKDGLPNSKNLNWYSTAVTVATGDKRFISLTKDIGYDAYYQGGHKSFKQDFDDHRLEIVVFYNNNTAGFDANFKIYNTKINYTGFDSLATYNTQTGLTEAGVVKGHGLLDVDGNYTAFASGDQSLTMVSLGGVGTPASGICTLFVDSDTADQAMTLVINQDKATNMGNSGYGYVVANGAVEMNGVEMNLFTSGGQINTDMILFLKQNDPVFAVSPTMTLSTAGALLSFPREEANTSLYLLADLGYGSPSGVMNLMMPNVKSGTFFDKRLLYIEGKQPTGEIPLYVQVNESGVNTIPLYTVGPDFYSPSGVMNMFIKQKDLYGQATITPVPTVGRNNNTTLMTKGYGYPSGIMTMSVPNVFGSGTNSLTLSTRGSN